MGDLNTSTNDFTAAQCARATQSKLQAFIDISSDFLSKIGEGGIDRSQIVLMAKEVHQLADSIVVSGGVLEREAAERISADLTFWGEVTGSHNISAAEIEAAELPFTTSTGRPTCRALIPRSF